MATSTLSKWFQGNVSMVTSVIAAIAIIGTFQIINPFFLSPPGRVTLVYAMSYF